MKKLTTAALATAAVIASAPAATAMTGAYAAADNTMSRATAQISTTTSYCSGVLVAPDKVLTAAHCLGNGESTTGSLGFGTSGLTQRTGFSDSRIHPQADIAMITLDNPVGVTPAPLYFGPTTPGSEGYSFGWGGVRQSGQLSTTVARVFDETITLRDADGKSWRGISINPIGSTAKYVGGDSGGPFFLNNQLVGVTSVAAVNFNAAVVTRLNAYPDWVGKAVRGEIPPAAVGSIDGGSIGSGSVDSGSLNTGSLGADIGSSIGS